jgi:hypothetical protein
VKTNVRFMVALIGLMTVAALFFCAFPFPLANDMRPSGDAVPDLLLALAVLKLLDLVDSWCYEWEPNETKENQ